MGNKQELEVSLQQQGYDLTGITKTWWDGSHDWSAAVEGYRLFRKGRMGKQGGRVALYVMESSWNAWSSALGWVRSQ